MLSNAPLSALLASAPSALVQHGADKATARIRVLGTNKFAVIAHAGFTEPYPDLLWVLDGRGTEWYRAFSRGCGVEVPDGGDDEIFNGTEDQGVLLDLGSHALASFPILDAEDDVVGSISAYYATPGFRNDLDFVASLAQRISARVSARRQTAEDYGSAALENMQLR